MRNMNRMRKIKREDKAILSTLPFHIENLLFSKYLLFSCRPFKKLEKHATTGRRVTTSLITSDTEPSGMKSRVGCTYGLLGNRGGVSSSVKQRKLYLDSSFK